MSGYLEILVVAFGMQLAVLPGEKVQFIIAGLSTRYHPLVVVSAAGAAFAGWTALEVLFGNALKGALPEVYLTAFTAGLFFLFAVLMLRSAPEPGARAAETDGGLAESASDIDLSILGWDIPPLLGGWLPIFLMMTAGEFGDKTQMVTIGLAVDHGATSAIWIGEMLAIIPVSLLNAYFFHRFSHLVNLRKAHLGGAALFVFFASDNVLQLVAGISIWERIISGVTQLLVATI